jgi:hypothetical protein
MPKVEAKAPEPGRDLPPSEQEYLKALFAAVALVDAKLELREDVGDPMSHGMPDLLFGRGEKPFATLERDEFGKVIGAETRPTAREKFEETEEECRARQAEAIKHFVENGLFISKDGERRPIVLIHQSIAFIADIFYGRTRRAIVWKPRGGGGSLSAAILIFLLMVYRQKSVVDVGGSQDQSLVVYNYVKYFWDCVPGLEQKLLERAPAIKETRLKTGCNLKCVPATEKQARGKHPPVLVSDESCSDDLSTDEAVRAALSGVVSEANSIVVLLSTFHVPTGLFQEYWDYATEKGFVRYRWDIFDCMLPCQVGLDEATPEDPKALNYCKTKCPLTWTEEDKGSFEDEAKYRLAGCQGKARDAQGFMPFGAVTDAQKLHSGTHIFPIEFACQRPHYASTLYDPEVVDASAIDNLDFDEKSPKCVGIDWGFESAGSMAMALAVKCEEYIGVPECLLSDHLRMKDILKTLNVWQEQYGAFVVFADRSHTFENRELAANGFGVEEVNFATLKELGVRNVQRHLVTRRLRLLSEFVTLREQMKGMRRNQRGTILKKNDHGPDALMCSMLYFLYDQIWTTDAPAFKKDVAPPVRGLASTQVSEDGRVVLI